MYSEDSHDMTKEEGKSRCDHRGKGRQIQRKLAPKRAPLAVSPQPLKILLLLLLLLLNLQLLRLSINAGGEKPAVAIGFFSYTAQQLLNTILCISPRNSPPTIFCMTKFSLSKIWVILGRRSFRRRGKRRRRRRPGERCVFTCGDAMCMPPPPSQK